MKPILKRFSDHGTFIQPEALNYILSKEKPEDFTTFLIKNLKEYPLVLTRDHITAIEHSAQPEIPSENDITSAEIKETQKKILSLTHINETSIKNKGDNAGLDFYLDNEEQLEIPNNDNDETHLSVIDIKKVKGWKAKSKDYTSEIKIIKDVTGRSTCEGTTKDFKKLFVNRYSVLRMKLQNRRREMVNVIPLNKVRKAATKEVQVIGIVKDVRTTVNGHRVIEIEDETGIITAIALKNDYDIVHLAKEVVFDEIIGVKGQLSRNGDLLIIKSIVFPDVSIQHEQHKAEVPVCVAFLSDIHIGSKMFLEHEWQAFLRWINGELGNSRQKDVAGRIKYLVIPGDVVDGIGIYPDQEKELSIKDVYRQYETLAEQLQLIPDHISIVIQPGNHDAVRPAEPQPAFEKEIQDLFSDKDVKFVGNPCFFSLHDVEILAYHGQSLLDYATNIQTLKYNEPVEIMKMMLKKNHLAPAYGGYTPLAPEHADYMIIDKIPDIFVTGHVHMAQFGDYRGVTLINASSWQAQTSYQKMLNFIPDPAKLPIVDLKKRNITMMDFSKKLS